MFHSYVRTAAGSVVSINRVRFLMDKKLGQQAYEAASKAEPDHDHAPDGVDRLFSRDQWFYDYYCQRHIEKYGEPFAPDVDPNWS